MSSMPEGESVSMTAVPEAKTLKVVFAGIPWPSLPSHSPASDWSLLKAAAEYVPAQSGEAPAASSSTSNESLRCVTGCLLEENGAGHDQFVASTGTGRAAI